MAPMKMVGARKSKTMKAAGDNIKPTEVSLVFESLVAGRKFKINVKAKPAKTAVKAMLQKCRSWRSM